MKFSLLFFATAAAALPAVGPDYQRPAAPVPTAYRDLPAAGEAWKPATPADGTRRGAWWKAYGDPALDELETRALGANQDLQAAAARVEQARATAGVARSAYLPSVALDASTERQRYSLTEDNAFPQDQTNTYVGSLDASWELDLFGRVRRLNESARADAQASQADFESVRLALTADVATTLFALRALDQELRWLADGIGLRRRELDLVRAQRRRGAATDFDLARAETELASTEAESAGTANRRALLQDALSLLVGEPASAFAVPAGAPLPFAQVPEIPAGLPSDLLERRPDVAAAERALVAANARIGVAKAAFFPALSLTGGAGYGTSDLSHLFQADSRVWSIGPSLYLPLFQGGRNRATLARSQAAYTEAVAVYRQRVLTAFREVQDALTSARLLAEQSSAQDRALAAAQRAGVLAQKRYRAGFVSFFEVIDAQRTVLAAERASTQVAAQRLTNSVALIKSLGGGWAPSAASTTSRAFKASHPLSPTASQLNS